MCATSSAHGHHFCVADGRSNKIGTSDNFRLRVISLSCPVEPETVPPLPSTFSSPLRYLPIYLLHLFLLLLVRVVSQLLVFVPWAAHRPLYSRISPLDSAREDDDHYFKIAPNIDAKSVSRILRWLGYKRIFLATGSS